MSESQLVRRPPDPKVRVSSTDGHRMLSVPKEPVQRQNLRQPRHGTVGAPLKPVPPGVTIGTRTTIQATVGRPAKVVEPARPTPVTQARAAERAAQARELAEGTNADEVNAAFHRSIRDALDRSAPASAHRNLSLLDDAELALVTQLVRTFAAHAGGDALATCESVLAKLAAQVEARDAATEHTTGPSA